MTDHADIVRSQFGQQADRFSQWTVTHNEQFLSDYFRFCKMQADDELLDVACGTGDFSLYCAERIRRVKALDISPEMLQIGRLRAKDRGIINVEFVCGQVENLDLQEERFSIVSSKAAFHHFPEPETVFRRMVACCRPGGRIALNDIVAYDAPQVDEYFERLEKSIDRSHFRSWPREAFLGFYRNADIDISRAIKTEILLDVEGYIGHAVQSESDAINIRNLLDEGMKNPATKEYFSEREGRLFFRRPVLLIMGVLPEAEN